MVKKNSKLRTRSIFTLINYIKNDIESGLNVSATPDQVTRVLSSYLSRDKQKMKYLFQSSDKTIKHYVDTYYKFIYSSNLLNFIDQSYE